MTPLERAHLSVRKQVAAYPGRFDNANTSLFTYVWHGVWRSHPHANMDEIQGSVSVHATREMDYAVFVNLFEMPYPLFDYDRRIWFQCYCRSDAYDVANVIDSVTRFSYDLVKLVVHYVVLIRVRPFDTTCRAVDFYLAKLADGISV